LKYLTELRRRIKLDPKIKDEFLAELETHIEDKNQELRDAGLSEEEAGQQAVASLGSAKIIARQIYEVYSQGTWKQAMFSALPYLIIAIFLALNLITNLIWLISLSAVTIITAVYGWSHGKPAWLFPWLGCLFFYAIVIGIMLIYLPSGWNWFATFSYIPFAAIILFLIIKQTLKRDWLFVSLMMLPVPAAAGWVLALTLKRGLSDPTQIYQTAIWIALTFAIFAFSIVFFTRVKSRGAKTIFLLLAELLMMIVLFVTCKETINFFGWVALLVLSIVAILGPALLERRSKPAH
jgi:hypothetical protein